MVRMLTHALTLARKAAGYTGSASELPIPVQDIGPRPAPTACRLEYLTHPAGCGGRCALTTIERCSNFS